MKKILDNTTLAAEQNAPESVKYHDWQPIETAPKDGRRILLCNELWGDTFGEVQIGHEQQGKWLFDSEMNINDIEDEILDMGKNEDPMTITQADYQPTHWMPLPEPPTTAAPSSATKI